MSKKVKKNEGTEQLLALTTLATDLNTALTLDPPIDVEGSTLEADIKELLPDIKDSDGLSKESWKTLKAMGWKATKQAVEKKEKTKKAEKTPTEKKAKHVRTSTDNSKTITLLVKENPKREGSGSAKRFAKYKTGQTVTDALKAGVTRGDILWDLNKGFIKVS